LEHADAIPTIGLTALQGIDDVLNVKKGEAVIIHGASGGVGTLTVQFAKLRGARLLAMHQVTMAWPSRRDRKSACTSFGKSTSRLG
jgi:NADPH:quinone reductase-like Zn-dependent oxidoreductase